MTEASVLPFPAPGQMLTGVPALHGEARVQDVQQARGLTCLGEVEQSVPPAVVGGSRLVHDSRLPVARVVLVTPAGGHRGVLPPAGLALLLHRDLDLLFTVGHVKAQVGLQLRRALLFSHNVSRWQ